MGLRFLHRIEPKNPKMIWCVFIQDRDGRFKRRESLVGSRHKILHGFGLETLTLLLSKLSFLRGSF